MMRRKTLVIALAVLFVLSGGYVFAQKWSAETMKKIEELKSMAGAKKEMAKSMPGVTEIKAEELKSWLDQGKKFVLLDDRTKSDYEKEHIPGALRLAPDDLEPDAKAAEKLGLKKDDIIVNYCNGIRCWRSPGTIVFLSELGYKNLYWYREGIPDWIKKGYDTVEGKEVGTWKK